MKNSFWIVFSSLLIISCQTSNKETTEDFQVTAQYSIAFRKFSPGDAQDAGTVDTLSVNEIRTRKKNIWIYKATHTTDTLITYKDSVTTLNSKKLEALKTRQFEFNNSQVLVSKYPYTLPSGIVLNVFAADGLGVILVRSQGEPGSIVTYDTDYGGLHKNILNDAAFFKFEPDAKKTLTN